MTVLVELRSFKGYPILGKEEEYKVKRDILTKLSRRLNVKAKPYAVIQNWKTKPQEADRHPRRRGSDTNSDPEVS
jgi:hypothetical protein